MLGRTFYLMGFVDGWSPMGIDDGGRRRSTPTSRPRQGLALPARRGHRAAVARSTGRRKGLARPRPARRLPRAPGRPVDRVPRAHQGPRAPGLRRGVGVAARAPADRLRPRAHARRLPVRQRHVPATARPAQLAAIVDWEMGTVGDPKLDLGWVVQSWPDDTMRAEAASVELRRHVRHAVARPRCSRTTPTVSGRQVDDIDYYVRPRQVEARGRARAGLPARRRRREAAARSARSCSTSCRARPTSPRPPTTGRERRRPSSSASARGHVLVAAPQPARGPQRADAGADRGDRRPRSSRPRPTPTSGPSCSPAPATARSARAWTCGPSPAATSPARRRRRRNRRAFYRLLERRGHGPGVGAANATAVAGGFELLLGCDVIVASSDAKFGLPEVKRGLFPARRRHDARQPHPARRRARADAHRRQHRRRRARYELGLVNAVVAPRRGARRRARARRADRGQRPARRDGDQGARAPRRHRRRARRRAARASGSRSSSPARTPRKARRAFVEKRAPRVAGPLTCGPPSAARTARPRSCEIEDVPSPPLGAGPGPGPGRRGGGELPRRPARRQRVPDQRAAAVRARQRVRRRRRRGRPTDVDDRRRRRPGLRHGRSSGAFAEEVVVAAHDRSRRVPDGVDDAARGRVRRRPPHRVPRAALSVATCSRARS